MRSKSWRLSREDRLRRSVRRPAREEISRETDTTGQWARYWDMTPNEQAAAHYGGYGPYWEQDAEAARRQAVERGEEPEDFSSLDLAGRRTHDYVLNEIELGQRPAEELSDPEHPGEMLGALHRGMALGRRAAARRAQIDKRQAHRGPEPELEAGG